MVVQTVISGSAWPARGVSSQTPKKILSLLNIKLKNQRFFELMVVQTARSVSA
jgi:hypothetical protein